MQRAEMTRREPDAEQLDWLRLTRTDTVILDAIPQLARRGNRSDWCNGPKLTGSKNANCRPSFRDANLRTLPKANG